MAQLGLVAVRAFERFQCASERDHQDGQPRRAPGNDRGRVDLSAARPGRRVLLDRNDALNKAVRDIAWKEQVRLCARYRRLAMAGKSTQTVVTAIARELLGFAWAIAQQVRPAPV